MGNTKNIMHNSQQLQGTISIIKNSGNFVKIKDIGKIGHLVIPICNKHAVLSGIDKEIDQFTKEEIAKYTAIYLKNISIEEIDLAFQNERFNLYPNKSKHYNFFSIDYYVEIITKYKDWKQEMMITHNIQIDNKTITLPQQSETTLIEEKKETTRQFITQIFNNIKSKKNDYIDFVSYTLYEDFLEHKLIVISNKDKTILYQKMLDAYLREKKQDLRKTSKIYAKQKIQSFLQDFNAKKSKNAIVINRCKAYLVCKSLKEHYSVKDVLKKINL